MKYQIFIAFLLLTSISMNAQTKGGGISAAMLQQIEKSYGAEPSNKALANAMATNSIDNLAKNFKNQGPVDTYFSVETPQQSIHDQKSSGRCWMFSGLNVLRSHWLRCPVACGIFLDWGSNPCPLNW